MIFRFRNLHTSKCAIIAKVFAIAALFSSCVSTKPVAYFSSGTIDTAKLQGITVPDQRIQKGDILTIAVLSDNPTATSIYNQAGGAGTVVDNTVKAEIGMNSAPSSSVPNGYLVDNNGNIRMHAIGQLHAEGLTKHELENTITSKLIQLGVLSNPYCIVRLSNFRITILGEVKSPGVFSIPTEKASILEAIGMAGDFTDFGLKDQVLLIREEGGQRSYKNVNLADPAIFTSPNFYLQQNDVLVIKANPKKPTALDQRTLQYISLGLAAVSTAAIIISLLR